MSKISTAVSAILAAAAIGASGVAGAVAPVGAADHFFPTSGSTALDNAIKEYFLLSGGICKASTVSNPINVYVDGTSNLTSGNHQMLVVCNSNAAFGNVAVGDVIGLAKESNGGSEEGTINVARATPINFLDGLASAGITCSGGPTAVSAGTNYAHQQAYNILTGCSTLKAYAPTIGWADEQPAAWLGFGDRPINNTDISNLFTDPLVQNVFGFAVSLNLYRSLQNMQGLTVGDDTLANMPSLSTSVIAGLYSGFVPDWSSVVNAAGTAVTGFVPAGVHALKGATAFICRRGDSSGTNAFVDLHLFNNRCSTSAAAQQTPSTADNTTACKGLPAGLTAHDFGCAWQSSNLADTVFPGSGGGDVAACLDAHNHNDDFAIGNLTTNTVFGNGNAIGGSTDTTTGSNTHFRYIAIDGRLPNLTSVANGQYPFIEDNVLNTLNTANANVKGLRTYISSATTGFSNTTVVRDFIALQAQALSSGAGHPADPNWNTGVLFDALNADGIAQNTPPVTTAQIDTVAGNPVSAYTQLFQGFGQVLNNCQPPIVSGGVINK
jgi:hypothetical protein